MKKALLALALIFVVPSVANAQHIVKNGDTLWSISKQHGMFFSRVKELNPQIKNPNVLRIGQKVNVEKEDGGKVVVDEATQIIEFAQALIPRTTYVFGGNVFDGKIKTDCSGWTKYIFEKHGIILPRVSWEQSKTGKPVKFAQMQKGDLMFFGKGGKVSHVGIYMGKSQWISNLGTGKNVKIMSTNGSWCKTNFLWATRVL